MSKLLKKPGSKNQFKAGIRRPKQHVSAMRAAVIEALEQRQLLYGIGDAGPGSQPVHQWLTAEAYVDYKSQFGPSFLDNNLVGPHVTPASPLGAALQDAVYPTGSNGNLIDWGNKYLIEGAQDEDIPGQTPFRSETSLINSPSLNHFWQHGSSPDGTPYIDFSRNPMYGLSLGVAPLGTVEYYDSAPDRAVKYVTGGVGLNDVTDRNYSGYSSIAATFNDGNESTAAWLLGHVLHLAQDMTVPAHVQGDPHLTTAFLSDPDIYHEFVDWNPNLNQWGVSGQPATESEIKSPQQFLSYFEDSVASNPDLTDGGLQSIPAEYQPLYAVFADNASMADDYDTGETSTLGYPAYDGQTDMGKRRNQWQTDINTIESAYGIDALHPPAFDLNAVLNEFATPPKTTGILGIIPLSDSAYASVQNALANYRSLSQEIANKMVPLAITSSAELIRYFDSLIDQQAPTVNFVNLSDSNEDDPQTVLNPTIDLTALSSDQNSGNTGVGINTIKYEVSQLVNGNWTPYQPIAQSGPAASYFQAGPSAVPDFYDVAGLASHAVFAGHLGQTYRFQISVEDGAGNVGTDVQYATFQENVVLPSTGGNDTVNISKATINGLTWAEVNDDGRKSSYPVDDVNEFIFNGGNGNDYFKNNTAVPCSLNGGNGKDTLDGGGGPDTINGGAQNDVIDGNDGDNIEDGGSGTDRFMFNDAYVGTDRVENSGGGPDVIDFSESKVTTPGVDIDLDLSSWQQVDLHLLMQVDATPDIKGLVGSPENDTLTGSSIKNAIVGEGGQDTLSGGGAGTTYEGDSGINTLIDKLTGNDDTLTNAALTEDGVRYSLNTIEDVVLQCPNIEDDELNTSAFTGNETIYGGDKDDHIIVGDGQLPSVIYGGPGNDTIQGGNGPDIIDGGPGNDSLLGEGGNDTIQGDDGADYIDGGSGNNSMAAGHDPNDHIVGEPGNPDPAGPPPVQNGQNGQQPVVPDEPYFPDPDYPGPDNDDDGLGNYYENYYGEDNVYDYDLNRDVLISGAGKNYIDVSDGDLLDVIHGAKSSDQIIGDGAIHSTDVSLLARDLSTSSPPIGDVTEQPLPAAPFDLTASAVTSTQITLRWVDASTAYNDQRADISADGQSWSEAAIVSSTATSATVAGLIPNTAYYFSIRATSSVGASISEPIVARTAPAAPTNLHVTSANANSVSLAWNPSSSLGVIYRIADGTDGINFTHLADANGTTYTATGLTTGTTYYFEVRAADAAETVFSVYTNTVSATPSIPIPAPPSNLRVTSIGTNSVSLAWDASSSPDVVYRIADGTDGVNFTHLDDASGTTYTATGLTTGTTYYFEVRAADSTETVFSIYTNTVNATPFIPVPSAPTNLRVTSVGANSVSLAWDPSSTPGVIYRIADGTDGVNFTHLDDSSGTTYTATGLTAGTTYYFEVRAADSTETVFSVYTNTVNATPSIPVPAAPTNLRVTFVGGTSVSLAWDPSSTPGVIYRIADGTDGVNFTHLDDATTTTYNATGLQTGTTYYFLVRAADSTETALSAYTNSVSATPSIAIPAPPTNLRVTSVGATSVSLAWDPSTTPGVIYRIADGTDGVNFTHLDNASGTTYTANGLQTGKTYYFLVRAADSTETALSVYTNSVTATPSIPIPAAPTNLRVTSVRANSVSLAWDPSPTPGVIYRIADGTDGVNFTHLDDASGTTYTATGLQTGTTYYFLVRAADSTETSLSVYTNSVSATPSIPIPAAPTNLRVTSVGATSVSLAWDPSPTPGVIYRIADGTDGVNFTHLDDASGITYTATGLQTGRTYYFLVRAADSTETALSVYTNSVSATPSIPIPAAPTNLRVTSVAAKSVSLAWDPSPTPSVIYRIAYSTDGVNFTHLDDATGTTYTATGLTTGTTYYFLVRAADSTETALSVYSNSVNATPYIPIPAAPTNLIITSVGTSSVGLAWDLSPTPGVIYRIAYSTDGINFTHLGDASGATYTATGLKTGTTYYFEVRAADSTETVFSTYTNTVHTKTK